MADKNPNFHMDGKSISDMVDARIGALTNMATSASTSVKGAVKEAAAVAVLTDSTGGTPASTLVTVRSDTGAHTAADANANFASLNAQVNAIQAALITAGVQHA